METIEFTAIDKSLIHDVVTVFEFIASGKRKGVIDEGRLSQLLGERFQSRFIHTKAESDEWLLKWRANSNIEMPWDFGSWVDALMESEVELESIDVDQDGYGCIRFKQLAWPTGGIAAIEEIVRIYGGMVQSESAI